MFFPYLVLDDPLKRMVKIIQAHFILHAIYILDRNLHKCEGNICSSTWIPTHQASVVRLFYLSVVVQSLALMIKFVISK